MENRIHLKEKHAVCTSAGLLTNSLSQRKYIRFFMARNSRI